MDNEESKVYLPVDKCGTTIHPGKYYSIEVKRALNVGSFFYSDVYLSINSSGNWIFRRKHNGSILCDVYNATIIADDTIDKIFEDLKLSASEYEHKYKEKFNGMYNNDWYETRIDLMKRTLGLAKLNKDSIPDLINRVIELSNSDKK